MSKPTTCLCGAPIVVHGQHGLCVTCLEVIIEAIGVYAAAASSALRRGDRHAMREQLDLILEVAPHRCRRLRLVAGAGGAT